MAGNNMAAQHELDIPRTQPDTRSGILTLLPSIAERESEKQPTLSLEEIGSREFFNALEAHHLSTMVMAADIAIALKISEFSNAQPVDAGRAFLSTPELVREVAETNTKITSQIPGRNEKPIRERAEEVFPVAQKLMILENEQLEDIRSMYTAKPGSTGRIFNELAIKDRAQAMIALATGQAALTRTEDKKDLDLARGFDGRLLSKDPEPKEPSKPVEPVVIYDAPRELVRV